MDSLERFSTPVARWFAESFDAPTPAQAEAWDAISSGEHSLVVAPTGSGKTLAAFLWSLDSLFRELTAEPDAPAGVRVLYVSPLKALGVDIERNLAAPLEGIGERAAATGTALPPIRTAVRSGDTSSSDRARMLRHPPHVLITTPESLYLMLTSQAQEILRTVGTVIIDEIHAVAPTKRGTHLALSLERLDALLERPAQRIGLSATVRPLDTVAQFLAGDQPVRTVTPPSTKKWDLNVRVTVDDLTDLPELPQPTDVVDSALPTVGSLWPHIEGDLLDRIEANRSTLVFVNSRRTCERLTSRLNELHHERLGGDRADRSGHLPAQLMTPRDEMADPPEVIARSHHGSVSKEERQQTEQALKAGTLRCVVATSSLELGIDMGAIDEVIHMGAPPSVSSALQRTGRAGHRVDAVSRSTFYPLHRLDVLHCAAIVDAMRVGDIESIAMVPNALDVLAQQLVAHVAAHPDGVDVEECFDMVRRAGPYRGLDRGAFDRTLGLICGAYPSTDFPDLRARVDHADTGLLTPRRGAQRVAITSGGTIPDRGLFAVHLEAGEEAARRVGELDEEMVHETRVGDVITLGASSWRVTAITHERVLVVPAPGHTGRLPFWHGDLLSRPAAAAERLGEVVRRLHEPDAEAPDLDTNAFTNLVSLIADQRAATGVIPDERHVVVERLRDDLGDWRIVVHSPWGRAVNQPWSAAIAARLIDATGIDPVPVAGDDGFVLRLPDGEVDVASLIAFDADEIDEITRTGVASSALFAARFRECAARALLLPRRDPGARAPLWQQRLRAKQLLEVARHHPDFPVSVETARECLGDVYDLPALRRVMEGLGAGRIEVTEVERESASPFAHALLFEYTGNFVYDADTPLAEKRAALLSLDPDLLAQLLGTARLAEVLDPTVIDEVERELQHLAPERHARNADQVTDLLRTLGPLTRDEIAARCVDDAVLEAGLAGDRPNSARAWPVEIGGRTRFAATDDLATLHDAMGVALPVEATPGPVAVDPIAALLRRYTRTHGPFSVATAAEALGLGQAVVRAGLEQLCTRRDVARGEFRAAAGVEFCDAGVLRRIRARSLAATRAQIEPVEQRALVEFLAVHHRLGAEHGVDGTFAAIEQLAGVALPASAWESLILPARVPDYRPQMLDDLIASGDVVACGHRRSGRRDGWVSLHPTEVAPLTLGQRPPDVEPKLAPFLDEGGLFFTQIVERARAEGHDHTTAEWEEQLLDLWWAGLITPDSFAPVRAMLQPQRSARSAPTRRHRLRLGRTSAAQMAQARRMQSGGPRVAGRWTRLPRMDVTNTDPAGPGAVAEHGQALGEILLHRHGIVTRDAVRTEQVAGGFALVYRVLREFEDAGLAQRGYFVEGLGAAQFATSAAVDALRGFRHASAPPRLLAATDPANPFGAALPWPKTTGVPRPARRAGAMVAIVEGTAALFIERGGRSAVVLSPAHVPTAAGVWVAAARAGRIPSARLDTINGESALGSTFADAFLEAGFVISPNGLRLRASSQSGGLSG